MNPEALTALMTKADEDYSEYLPFYERHAESVHKVICLEHGGVVAIEAVMPGSRNRGHVDGSIVIPVGDLLLSSRARLDGTMGYQCACGANTIILPEEKVLQEKRALYPHIAAEIQDKIKARTSEPEPLFERQKVK